MSTNNDDIMNVFVKDLLDISIVIQVRPSLTIAEVGDIIFKKIGHKLNSVIVIKGKVAKPEDTLASLKVKENYAILLNERFLGGSMKKRNSFCIVID